MLGRVMWRQKRAFRKTAKREAKRIKPEVLSAKAAVAKTAAEIQQALDTLPASTPRCPRCKSRMALRDGAYGEFWGCVNYPPCRGTRQLSEGADSG